MVNWEIRAFKEGDIKDFLNWRKYVARRNKTMEFWKWEYLKGPWGPVATLLAVDNEKIVGQYSTQRYEAFYFGKKIMASLSFDTGTHPDYRRQGIFKTLGTQHFQNERKQNIHFSTGFPNENFWPGGKKFGWRALYPVPLLENNNIFDINVEKISNYEINEIQNFGKEFEGFSENFKDDIPIYLNRTTKYLNWRFIEKPGLVYQKFQILDKTGEMVAYFISKYYTSKEQKILHLIDFLLPNDEMIYKTVLNFLVTKAKEKRINKITLFLNRYHPFRNFLSKNGFEYKKIGRIFIVRNNTGVFNDADLFEKKNYYITMADSDVI